MKYVVLYAAATGEYSAARLKEMFVLKASVCILQRLLERVDWLQYSKMDNTSDLTPAHKKFRLHWAKLNLLKPNARVSTIFSDEKMEP